jgi:hypothetical protein
MEAGGEGPSAQLGSDTPDGREPVVPDAAAARRAYKKRYREEHSAEIRSYRAQYHEANRAEVNRKNREYMRDRALRLRSQEARRRRDRDRVQRWTEANRDRKRETTRRWDIAHPEKRAEYSRRYFERNREAVLARGQRWRDQNREAVARRDWHKRNREHLSEAQRQYRATNSDAYARTLESNRESKRLARRLKASGLPSKQIRRVPAAERREHDAESREFFERERAASARKRLKAEYSPLGREALDSWSAQSPLARRREQQLSRFRRQLTAGASGVSRIREEVRMDAVARQLRGGHPDVDAGIRQRVFDVAGGRDYLSAGGDPVAAAVAVEEALAGRVESVARCDGSELVWIPGHVRAGHEVFGYWRRRPG